jgi:hypothetical protein
MKPSEVSRIALSLRGAEQVRNRFAFGVRIRGALKEFAWVWMERVDPKKPRVANRGVMAVRVSSLEERDKLLAAHPKTLFTEPHYAGYPAVLVRLDAVRAPQLRRLLFEAWRTRASKDLIMSVRTPR